jgi:hypothetical protein
LLTVLPNYFIPSYLSPILPAEITTTGFTLWHFFKAFTRPIPLAKSTSDPALSPNPGESVAYISSSIPFGKLSLGILIAHTNLVVDVLSGLLKNFL